MFPVVVLSLTGPNNGSAITLYIKIRKVKRLPFSDYTYTILFSCCQHLFFIFRNLMVEIFHC
jgi:hypothetical protein